MSRKRKKNKAKPERNTVRPSGWKVFAKQVLIALGSMVIFGLLFGGASLFREFEFRFFCIGFTFGACCGYFILPYLDKAYSYYEVWNVVIGVVGGSIIAWLLCMSIGNGIMFGLGGGVLGVSSRWWIKHMQLP